MASALEIVEAAPELRKTGDFTVEDEATLAAAKARLFDVVAAGRDILADPDHEFTFDDFKKLKAAETALGLRKPKGPGFSKSLGLISQHPGEAAAAAGGLAARAGGELVVGAGNLARNAVRAVATSGRSIKGLGRLASETAQELASPEGAAAAVRGIADVTGLGGGASEFGLNIQNFLTGRKVSRKDIKEFSEFLDARERATKGKALGAGQLIGGALLGGGRTAVGAAARGAGVLGGITASQGGSPEDVAVAALGGAVLPSAVQGVAKAGTLASRPLTTRLPRAEGRAARAALGRIIKDPEDVGRVVAQIGRRTGEPAPLAAGLPEAQAAKFGQTVAVGAPETQQEIAASVRRAVAGQGKRITAKIGTSESADAIRTLASDRLDRVMQPHDKFGNKGLNLGEKPVTIPFADVNRFSKNPFFNSLPRIVQEKFRAAVDRNKPAVIKLSELDELRQSFDTDATRSTTSGRSFLDASSRIRELGVAAQPIYGKELTRFAEQQFRADAVELGRKALTGSKSAQDVVKKSERLGKEAESLFDLSARARAKASKQGFIEGARGSLITRANSGAESSTQLLKEFVGSKEFKQKLGAAFGARKAADLVGTGRADLKRTAALATAGAAARKGASAALSNTDLVGRVIEGSIIAGGKASGAFEAGFVKKLITSFTVPKNVAIRMARDALDPAKAPQLIKQLKARKISDKQIVDLYRRSAIEAGILQGEGQ